MPPPVVSKSAPQGIAPVSGKRFCFAYPLDFTDAHQLAASGGTDQLVIAGDPNQRWNFVNIGFVSDGPFLIQLNMSRLGGGLFFNPISSETLLGQLDRPGFLPFPIEILGSESITVVLTNDNGAVANDVRLTFWGFRDLEAAGC